MEELEEQSSPNLSIELVDEDIEDPLAQHLHFESITNSTKSSPPLTLTSLSSMSTSSGPSSLKLPGERFTSRMALSDEFMLNDSNPPIISNYEDTEIEDFPVNNAQPPDYAPKNTSKISNLVTFRQKSTMTTKKTTAKVGSSRLSKGNSMSSQDLTQLNEATSTSTTSTGTTATTRKTNTGFSRVRRDSHTNKENVKAKQQNIPVTIVTNKPAAPTRAKTALDLKSKIDRQQQQHSNRPVQRQGLQNATTQRNEKTTNHTTTTTINSNTTTTNINYNGVMGSNGSNYNRTSFIQMPAAPRNDLYTSR
uniref:Uncharacterized protein n=1 Tax=Megaselia scalaris TaxID=36166 RepID=T1GNQ4_MEGSC